MASWSHRDLMAELRGEKPDSFPNGLWPLVFMVALFVLPALAAWLLP